MLSAKGYTGASMLRQRSDTGAQPRRAAVANPSARKTLLRATDPATAGSASTSYSSTYIASHTLPSNATSAHTAKSKINELLARGHNNYRKPEVFAGVISDLIRENPTPQPGAETPVLGQGTWEVFYAPHIAKMSQVMGVRFEPIRYVLNGITFTSNVRFEHPVFGTGWLSAGGSLIKKYDDSVEVSFQRFWMDFGADSLRPDIPHGAGADTAIMDTIVGTIGRAAFFPQWAVFPIPYLDSDLAVFRFTPLDSLIAVRRTGI